MYSSVNTIKEEECESTVPLGRYDPKALRSGTNSRIT